MQQATEAEMQRQHDALAAEGERQRQQDELARKPVPAPLPTALLEPARALLVNSEQRHAIAAVRERFLKAMASAGDPASQEYAERWMTEQARADEQLGALLGSEDFSKFGQEGRYGE